MPSPYILTLDIGTSSTRALLFDAAMQSVPGVMAQKLNEPRTSPEGDLTFDLESLLANVIAVLDETTASASERGYEIGAVVICHFAGNIAGLDTGGRPITPVFTYAHPSCGADAAALRQELGAGGAEAAHDRTGCLVHSTYLPAHFRWLQRTRPQILRAVDRWMLLGEYLVWLFTGVRATGVSAASWTGLLDRRRLTWDDVWLANLPVHAAQFGPIVNTLQPIAGLVAPWAARWPALAHTPWLPAVGDGAAANLGSGCTDARHVALTIGTTGALRVVVPPDLQQVPAGLWLYRVTAGDGLLGGATTEGGNLLAWLRSTLRLPALEALEAALHGRTPDGHGLTVLPLIAGERAPGWNDQAQAAFTGMTLATTALDLYQAVQEAIAYRFALIYARLAPHLDGGSVNVIASGGALASSPAWLQTMADVLGLRVQAAAEKELTCRGLALLGLIYLGVIGKGDFPPTITAQYYPDGERHRILQAALARQVALYERLL